MNRLLYILSALAILLPAGLFAQTVTYSDYSRQDSKDINFEIIGKMNNNFLVYKNVRSDHRITVLGNDMQIKDDIDLDFIPDKTFNIDFVAYPEFFYMIYQYQKKNILHCMAVKMDGNAKKIAEPVELDTTQISFFADNKIYTTIYSEDRKKIMVFKIHKKNDKYTLATLLFDDKLQLLHRQRQVISFDDRRDNYSNFVLDNDGNLVFTRDYRSNNRESISGLDLVTLSPVSDTLAYHPFDIGKRYFDDISLIKIDNLNKRYLVNAFYSKKDRGNIEGIFTGVWDRDLGQQTVSIGVPEADSLRDEARSDGQLKFALDNFVVRQVVVKKDGGFLLMSEDYTTQTRGNTNGFNRYDYFNNPYYFSRGGYGYSYYNPYYGGYYRPWGSYNTMNSTRYYYDNILVTNFDKDGRQIWNKVIHKDQYDDDNDNFLSFSTITSAGEIHFLFNDDKRNQIIADHSISSTGEIKRNPTVKSQEKNYEFMTRLSKQISAKQIIVPCMYRGYICFAKVDLE